MAKPILVVRIDPTPTEGASIKDIKQNYIDSTDNEYHVIVLRTKNLAYYPMLEVLREDMVMPLNKEVL